MPYGELAVLKTIGEKPVFAILDEKGNPATIIPDISEWLMKRLGTTIGLFISDAYFQITDEVERKKV